MVSFRRGKLCLLERPTRRHDEGLFIKELDKRLTENRACIIQLIPPILPILSADTLCEWKAWKFASVLFFVHPQIHLPRSESHIYRRGESREDCKGVFDSYQTWANEAESKVQNVPSRSAESSQLLSHHYEDGGETYTCGLHREGMNNDQED